MDIPPADMSPRQVLDYYSREDVQRNIIRCARDREVAGVFRNGSFSQRPGALNYPADILSMVRAGALELHCSVERWSQPMALKADNYSQLRTGWDFIVDLDCNDFMHGRSAAIVFCRALEEHGISGYSVKFTGGTGFHIGVPWVCMPRMVDYKPTESLFPELPRSMCSYLKEYCREPLERALMKLGHPEKLAEQAGVDAGKLITSDGIDPFKLVDIDSVLLSPRHLFRMPFSINMKSMLVSLPLEPSGLPSFERHDARHEAAVSGPGFLDSGTEGEADALVVQAKDWAAKNKPRTKPAARPVIAYEKAVEQENFPPCVKIIIEGLQDGRKRSLFILANFLSSSGWKWDDVGRAISGWNAKNVPPLPDNYIRAHLRWSGQRAGAQGRSLLPPGCQNEGWYESIGICRPDDICGGAAKTVKNPANYPLRKMGMTGRSAAKPRAGRHKMHAPKK